MYLDPDITVRLVIGWGYSYLRSQLAQIDATLSLLAWCA